MQDRTVETLDQIEMRIRRLEDGQSYIISMLEEALRLYKDRFETPEQIAERLNTSVSTVRRWVHQGKLTGAGIGSQMRIPVSQLYQNPYFEENQKQQKKKIKQEKQEIDRDQYFIKYGHFPEEDSA